MRVRLIFDLVNKGAALPFHHQYVISEFLNPYIKPYLSSIKEPSKAFYNFSSLKGQTSIGVEGLRFFSSRVSLVFSSTDPALIKSMVQKLFSEPQVNLGDLILKPIHVDTESAISFKNEMHYICLSPLAVASPKENPIDAKRFIHPSFDIFSDALYENTLNRMEQASLTPEEIAEYFQFQLVPDKEYLARIKDGEKKFARVFPVFINNEKYEVRGYTFPFTLYAHPKVQEFIFTSGFGILTEKGFGMLDIANTDNHHRGTPYLLKEIKTSI